MHRVIGNFSDGDDEFRCRENLPNLWRKVYPCCCHHFILQISLRCFVQNQSQSEADASSISSNTPSSDSPDGLSHFSQSQQDTAQSQVAGGKDAADVCCCQNGENSDLSAADAQKGVSIEKVSATVATQKQKNGKDSDSDKKRRRQRRNTIFGGSRQRLYLLCFPRFFRISVILWKMPISLSSSSCCLRF